MRNAFQKVSPASEEQFRLPLHPVNDLPRPRFALGLMGGGAWGAFTAGVLKVLVPVLTTIGNIKVISGTSAGAANAVLVGSGINEGDPIAGIRRLYAFWSQIEGTNPMMDAFHLMYDWALPPAERWPNTPRTAFNMMAMAQKVNPFMTTGTTHLISDMVRRLIPDWQHVQSGETAIHINALREHLITKRQEHVIMSGTNLTPHSIGASAALDMLGLHQILDKGDLVSLFQELHYRYRDGGYKQNPPLAPLEEADVTDIIVIKTHDRNHTPDTTPQMGAKLYHEEIHTDVAAMLLADSNRMNIHSIEIEMANGAINGWELNDSSKLNTSPAFISALREAGERAAHKWLLENFESLGQRSTYLPAPSALAELSKSGYHY